MQRTLAVFLFILCLAAAAYSTRYAYISDSEMTRFGDRIHFWQGDTLSGTWRFNEQPALWAGVVFTGQLILPRGAVVPDGVIFLGPPPIFTNQEVLFPEYLETMRECPYYGSAGMIVHLRFEGPTIHCWQWPHGLPEDSSDRWELPTTGCYFFDVPIQIEGVLTGNVAIGCAGTMYIVNDVRYADADPRTGETPASSQNILLLASEHEIKIANTPANGRNNSAAENWICGPGLGQTDPNCTDVVITAALWALGESITFEQQNDPESLYVSSCQPDDRGTFYLFGSMAQKRHGYIHRSTNGSTGYVKRWRYDERLLTARFAAEPGLWDGELRVDSLDFGEVAVGTTAHDTVDIRLHGWAHLGAVYTAAPFAAQRVPPFDGNHFRIPVSFTPVRAGVAWGWLNVATSGTYRQIHLRGRGVPAVVAPPLAAAPNPFNLSTVIRYRLEAAAPVRLALYDVLGREVKRIQSGMMEAGEHRLDLALPELASGIYFLRLQAGDVTASQKLLLLK